MDFEKRQTVFLIAAAAGLLALTLLCGIGIRIYRHSRPITVDAALVSSIELEREVWDTNAGVFRREPALLASREEIDAFCAWWNRMDAHRISPYVNLSGERWFLLFRFQDGTQPAYLRAAVREDSVRAHQQNYRYAAGAFPIAALWERIQSGEPLPAPPQMQESRISVLWFLPAATAAACAACLALRRRKKRRRR